MEINTKPVRLKPETREVLAQVRDFPEATPLYGLSAEEADRILRFLYEPMLDGAALPLVVLNGLRWYCRELARVFRAKRGYPLAFQLELVLRKWVALGSESELLQQLLCSIWEQLVEGQERTAMTPSSPRGSDSASAGGPDPYADTPTGPG